MVRVQAPRQLGRFSIGGIVAAFLSIGLAPAQLRPVSNADIAHYAAPFIEHQLPGGGFDVFGRVQTHLKAEIAMALAADATRDRSYADVAALDHAWVIAHHLEPGGGLNWDGPLNPYFFECHQHWFLIASHLLGALTDTLPGTAGYRRAVWAFLQRSNPAGRDFYLDNQHQFGPFFAYRSVDRAGQFMTQLPFKGAYEIGVALWSLSLVRAAGEIGTGSSDADSLPVAEYLERSVQQVRESPQVLGFFDPGAGRWIRSILWHAPGWWDDEAPDWKYALHLQEGVLEYERLTGHDGIEDEARACLRQLLSRIQPDGWIEDLPDAYGNPRYEYGEALSVLGLAAVTFADSDPWLALECLQGGQRVAGFALEALPPELSEDGAVLLAGLARLLQGGDALAAFAMDAREGPDARPTETARLSLEIAPSIVTGPVRVRWSLPAAAAGVLRVLDVTGRQVRSVELAEAAATGSLSWDLRGSGGRPLPGGYYFMTLDTPLGREVQGFVLER